MGSLRLQCQGIDDIGPGVAQHHWLIRRVKAHPQGINAGVLDAFQIGHALLLPICDANAKNGRIARPPDVVDRLAVMRPFWKKPLPPVFKGVHRPLPTLNSFMPMVSSVMAAMMRSSGDQCVHDRAGPGWVPTLWPTGSLALALPFFAIPKRLRRQWSRREQIGLLVLTSLAAAAAATGCGGGFALPRISVTSTITVAATSGSDVRTTTVQLTVN